MSPHTRHTEAAAAAAGEGRGLMTTATDGDLVRQARAGDAAAYGHLAHRWAARVLAVCHARTASADAAEDLAQEALLRGLRALPTLADPDKFGPWLVGIAVRDLPRLAEEPQALGSVARRAWPAGRRRRGTTSCGRSIHPARKRR